ncbi:hypothetical protein EYF80_039753 [Liparis tanakae]|uniref:Uncharacterized protein n=1 Tax=Liparis tanakae TaxID=230148 RepID=A0A4Z2GAI3_9TELE|nr:hypothetical protein EYF80_039753 [Liparis tanakae]
MEATIANESRESRPRRVTDRISQVLVEKRNMAAMDRTSVSRARRAISETFTRGVVIVPSRHTPRRSETSPLRSYSQVEERGVVVVVVVVVESTPASAVPPQGSCWPLKPTVHNLPSTKWQTSGCHMKRLLQGPVVNENHSIQSLAALEKDRSEPLPG